ncbi:MAG TPA: hypothetical protein VHB79_21905 [Polyangiaceae bacterium]|nr:hypothetical protein [Polyangiaceae bacterium]
MRRHLLGLALASASALSAVAACSNHESDPMLFDDFPGCLVNSDCQAPLVCAFQRCHVECVTTRDCDGTLRCVGAHEASRVCQLDVEASCERSLDCEDGFVCGSDGKCRDYCATDSECVDGQVCTTGVCAEPSELDASGHLPQKLDFSTCRLNSECAAGQRCAAGTCLPECVNDRDCAAGQACDQGACRQIPVDACQSDSECSQAGSSCVDGECRCECHADVDCSNSEICDGCACQPAPAPDCQSSSDCDAGKQCLNGACVCSCVADRDCAEGSLCDGCACQPAPGSTSVHDATIKDSGDIALMRGITDVETTLLISSSNLTTTAGLESLQSVGSIELSGLSGLSGLPADVNPFAGLANLKLIRGNFTIRNVPITGLQLNPELVIQGNVMIQYTKMTCDTLDALEKLFTAHGFSKIFDAYNDGDCSQGACSQGQCFLFPQGGPGGGPPPPGGP